MMSASLHIASVWLIAAGLWGRAHVLREAAPCSMTYSRPVWTPHDVAPSSSHECWFNGRARKAQQGYSLHEFSDASSHAQCKDSTSLVVFVPGSGGSFSQGRSLGQAIAHEGGCVVLFSLDFGGERTVAAGARALQSQVDFTLLALDALHGQAPKASITLVGHSLGGVIARAAASAWVEGCRHNRTEQRALAGIITLATPHAAPPLAVSSDTSAFYSDMNRDWRNARSSFSALSMLPLVSISGGGADGQILDAAADVETLLGGDRNLWAWAAPAPGGIEHQTIVWCAEIVTPLARALKDINANASNGFNWTAAIVRELSETALTTPMRAGSSMSQAASELAQLPLAAVNRVFSVAAAAAVGSLFRVIATDLGSLSASPTHIFSNLEALLVAPPVASLALSISAAGVLGLGSFAAYLRRGLQMSRGTLSSISLFILLAANAPKIYLVAFDASASADGVFSTGRAAATWLSTVICGVVLADLLLQRLLPAFGSGLRILMRRCCASSPSVSFRLPLFILILGATLSLAPLLPWRRLEDGWAIADIVRVINVGIVPSLLILTVATSFVGLAREPADRDASIAVGALSAATALTWAPAVEAALRSLAARPASGCNEMPGALNDVSRACVLLALTLFTLCKKMKVDEVGDDVSDGICIISSTLRIIAGSGDEAGCNIELTDALVPVALAAAPCACSLEKLKGCKDAEATAHNGDCWALLAERVSTAVSADAGRNSRGMRAEFEDAAVRAARWARVRLRPGSVLVEVPPAAQLPRSLEPAGIAGRCASVSRINDAGVRKSEKVSLKAVLALPLAVLRPFLCAACACPHTEHGGHKSAHELLFTRENPTASPQELFWNRRDEWFEPHLNDPTVPVAPLRATPFSHVLLLAAFAYFGAHAIACVPAARLWAFIPGLLLA
jgi:pimeloyl-ACP methyl ester carboxylesterase